MPDLDPDDVIEAAERRTAAVREQYLPAVEWFLDDPGMGPREEVVDDLADHLGTDRETATLVVGHLVSDEADPVQQVVDPVEGKFVGVIDHAEHEWFYAFDRYDDVEGRQRRAICAHCVHAERSAADVAHFTRSPEEYDLDRARGALALHYQVDHDGRALADVLAEDLDVDPTAFARRVGLPGPGALSLREVTRRLDTDPELADAAARLPVADVEVEPGAKLASGTVIDGNTVWHAGNDGTGSGLVADKLDGSNASDLWQVVNRTRSGAVVTTDAWVASTTLYSPTTGFKTVTLTPGVSTPVGFINTSSYAVGGTSLSFQSAKRNGGTATYNKDDLVTGLTTGDTFGFRFYVYSSGTQTLYLLGTVNGAEIKYPKR